MLTAKQVWLLLHLGLSVLIVHGFAGGFATLFSARTGRRRDLVRSLSTVAVAAAAWGSALTGTFSVYPWYRLPARPGEQLSDFPRSWLVARPDLQAWQTLGMEWKEYIGWLVPLLATGIAIVAVRYRDRVNADPVLRRTLAVLFVVAFAATIIAAVLGATLAKVAPNDFLRA